MAIEEFSNVARHRRSFRDCALLPGRRWDFGAIVAIRVTWSKYTQVSRLSIGELQDYRNAVVYIAGLLSLAKLASRGGGWRTNPSPYRSLLL